MEMTISNAQFEQLVSAIAVRLESEFQLMRFSKGIPPAFIGSTTYIVPPREGEFILIRNEIYQVMGVTHVFNNSKEPGTILLKWVRTLK